jgi:hypothetical protein
VLAGFARVAQVIWAQARLSALVGLALMGSAPRLQRQDLLNLALFPRR